MAKVKKIASVSHVLWNIDFFIAGIGIVLLVLLTVMGVFARYIMNAPFTWLEEVQFILTVQVAFWGASAAFQSGGHIAIEIVVDALPPMIRKIVETGIVVIVFITLIFITQQQASRSMELLRTGRTTQILHLPVYLDYAGVSLACLFMIGHYAIYNYKKFIRAGKKQRG
jgi:TRAP-type C4-dicarboxylate transport system permease small subunit